MPTFMKSLCIAWMFAASTSLFASPLPDGAATYGGDVSMTRHAPRDGALILEDWFFPGSTGGEGSTGNRLLIPGEYGQRAISSPLKAAPTPEPPSLLLLGSGLAGAAGIVLRRRRARK